MDKAPLPLLDHFQACVDAAFKRARRLETMQGVLTYPIVGAHAPLETPERWMGAIQRVHETFQTRHSVNRIVNRHVVAWEDTLGGRGPLTATHYVRGEPIDPVNIDRITGYLVRITEGSLVLATPVIPWLDRVFSIIRSNMGRDPDDRAWRYWRYRDITHWLAGTNANPTPVEHSLVLLVSVLLTHLGEELKAGSEIGRAHV